MGSDLGRAQMKVSLNSRNGETHRGLHVYPLEERTGNWQEGCEYRGWQKHDPSMNSEAWSYLSNPKGEFIWGEKFQISHSAAGKLLHGRDQQLNYKE